MSKIIQQVRIDEVISLYLVGFDEKTEILSFRSSLEPYFLQEEKIEINKGMVYTALHFFKLEYLIKYIKSNL